MLTSAISILLTNSHSLQAPVIFRPAHHASPVAPAESFAVAHDPFGLQHHQPIVHPVPHERHQRAPQSVFSDPTVHYIDPRLR